MKKDWNYIVKLSEGKPVTIERVRLESEDITVEGQFGLPPLARLRQDDQVFIAVFIKSHGSIKEMERHFGVSYPTIKSRLNRIGAQLDFVEVEESSHKASPIDLLEQGELSVEETIELLNKGDKNA